MGTRLQRPVWPLLDLPTVKDTWDPLRVPLKGSLGIL